jgi:hypothetical protein
MKFLSRAKTPTNTRFQVLTPIKLIKLKVLIISNKQIQVSNIVIKHNFLQRVISLKKRSKINSTKVFNWQPPKFYKCIR